MDSILNVDPLYTESALTTGFFDAQRIFLFFAIASIVSGFFVIISVNPMHSVFALVLTFVNTSVLLLLLGVEFLAFLFMIVYVGAIAILFLFVVMMLNIRIVELIENTTRYVPIGLIVGLVFFIELSILFGQPGVESLSSVEISFASGSGEAVCETPLSGVASLEVAQPQNSLCVLEIPVKLGSSFPEDPAARGFNATNIRSLGYILYTEYFVYFLVSSLVLLVSMVGAILLTLHHEKGVKRQDIYSQITSKYPGGGIRLF